MPSLTTTVENLACPEIHHDGYLLEFLRFYALCSRASSSRARATLLTLARRSLMSP